VAISVNYPAPVYVNGFQCKNCTDVDYAKKHIDPAHPKDGPYGIDAINAGRKPADASDASAVASKPASGVGAVVNLLV
jgi:hypothetical protein